MKFIRNLIYKNKTPHNKVGKVKLALLLLLFCSLFFANAFAQEREDTFVQNEVYVKIKESVELERSKSPNDVAESVFTFLTSKNKSEFDIEGLEASFYFSKSEEIRRIFRLKFGKTEKVEDLMKMLKQSEQIELVERIPIYKTSFTPNDLGDKTTNGQYGLRLINAIQAWDIAQGDPNIVVAVVDNAIDTNHEDLAANLVAGRDVADNDNNPNPPNASFYHGTHVAGIVGATTNNGKGVASIGYGISIMPIKATRDTGDPNIIHAGTQGIVWAAENGADVINLSYGAYGPYVSSTTFDQSIIDYAHSLGAIIVAAAGNISYSCHNYPAALNNVFSVANTDIFDQKTNYNCINFYPCALDNNNCDDSNECPPIICDPVTGTCTAELDYFNCGSTFGSWVDISAPGDHIRSTFPYNNYSYLNGTSMSAPLVAGLCGLILSVNPSLSQQQVLDCITSTAVDIDALNPGFEGLLGAGRIDAHQAVLCASGGSEPPIEPEYPLVCCEAFEDGLYNFCTISDEGVSWNYIFGDGVSYESISSKYILLNPGFCSNALSPDPGEVGNHKFLAHIGICPEGNGRKSSPNIKNSVTIKNYPNPFSNSTEIEYTVDVNGPVSLFVSDITGKKLSTLIENEEKEIGTHRVTFNGEGFKSGIYYSTLQVGDKMVTQKMVIAK